MDSFENRNQKKEIPHRPILTDLEEAINFGFTAVGQVAHLEAFLENWNDYEVEWHFESQDFHVSPSFGRLGTKGARQTVNIEFHPTEASAIVNVIVLHIDNEVSRPIKVSGVGKYPFLQISSKRVNFEKLLVGKKARKELLIKNLSQVGTSFSVIRSLPEEQKDKTFTLDVQSGFIPAQSSFLLKITFQPSVVGLVSTTHWSLNIPGGTTTEFSATGEAQGFDVRMSTSSINFGEIRISEGASRVFAIHNNSELPTKYNFFNVDGSNVFKFSKTRGILRPKSDVRLLVSFEPRNTICYYQRVFCIIQNHSILALDLLGTCYDLLFKPLPLFQHQIDSFRQRVIQGRLSEIDFKYMENSLLLKLSRNNLPLTASQLSQKNQNQLSLTQGASSLDAQPLAQSLLLKSSTRKQPSKQEDGTPRYGQDQKTLRESNTQLKSKTSTTQKTNKQMNAKKVIPTLASSIATGASEQQQLPLDQITERYEEEPISTYQSQIQLHHELFLKQSAGSRLVRTSEEFLDFGYQELMILSREKQITVFNQMNSKITIFWTKQVSSEVENSLSVFSVTPETITIKPHSEAVFNISFRPVKNANFFFQDLQFVAYKYTEKSTKGVVDSFQKHLLSQSLKLQEGQVLRHANSSSQLRLTNSVIPQDYSAEETLPPFCCQVSCVGHSFGPSSLVFVPMVSVLPSNNVYFKPCRVGEVSYQTIELNNSGDTPFFFRCQKDPQEVYSAYPSIGFVQPKQFALLVLQFKPKESKGYNTSLNIILNQNSSAPVKINVFGTCSEPTLTFQNDGKIFFPPSALGVSSKQKIRVENRSKIDLKFDINVPQKYAHELCFEPSSGIMRQNEHLSIVCSFAPYSKKNYKIKPIFKAREMLDLSQSMVGYFLPGSGNAEEIMKLSQLKNDNLKTFEKELVVYSKGADGSLSISPKIVDFGIVKVNFSERIVATIVNDSNCTFFIELKLVLDDEKNEDDQPIERVSSSKESQERPQNGSAEDDQDKKRSNQKKGENNLRELDQGVIDNNFKLDFSKGIMAANSKMDIGITFSPNKVNFFRLKLEVLATERDPHASIERSTKKLFVQKTELKIKASGNFPLLKIIDVRNDAISVASLWENFQINKINDELATDLNEHEINFLRIEQLNVEEANHLQQQLKNYTWNFGYLPNNQAVKPRKIVVTIQNIGGTELDFEFKLPSDSQIDVEPWADPGELQGDEAIEKAIVDRKIFQIIPKSGTLKPQQLQDIQLIYSPGSVDDGFQILAQKQTKVQSENHLLRVVLQINNGKPLVISLKGMTLSPTQGMLSVKQNQVTLPDCPIGMILPLKYPIEIQNVGLTKLNYSIEIQEIDQFGQNIDSKFEIFNVSNVAGSLMPNEKEYLYCLFKPLEAKKYYHILTIKATDFMKPLQDIRLNVVGQGYSKPSKRSIKMQENEYPQQRSSVSSIGSKVFFSIEEIDFGKLLPNETVHRIIILYNLSTDQKLSFDFTKGFSIQSKAPGLVCDDKFTIEPNQGRLEAGEFVELKLTLIQAQSPSIYSGEVECRILWGNHDINSNPVLTSVTSVSSQNIPHEKETLFLRIKKESKLDAKYSLPLEQLKPTFLNEHLMTAVIGQAIQEILNDENVYTTLKRLNNQPIPLFMQLDGEDPITINSISKGIDDVLEISAIEEGLLNDSIDIQELNEEGSSVIHEQQSFMQGVARSKVNTAKPKEDSSQDYRQQFLNAEFLDLTNLIMENTFFNIIQEATHKECDLLRLSKTFVQPNAFK